MTLTLPRPDDWHVHLRQDKPLERYARAHGAGFGRVLAMPNTTPPLVKPDEILRYRRRAEAASPGLTVLAAFRLMPGMSGADTAALAEAGIAMGKYYPDGATTNSEGGLTDWRQIADALSVMENKGMVLCIHGEDPAAPVLEREEAFLPVFEEIRRAHPQLKMVLEHVSTAAGVRTVAHDPGPSAATVTVQHLLLTLDNLIGGQLNPHLFCKPVLKFDADRQAIQDRVLAGDSRFFFGSDSAPHARGSKESGCCPAGCYTAPMILPALAQWFEESHALHRMEAFLCHHGRNFYGKSPNRGSITLERQPWTVPAESEGCVPLMAGKKLAWRLVR